MKSSIFDNDQALADLFLRLKGSKGPVWQDTAQEAKNSCLSLLRLEDALYRENYSLEEQLHLQACRNCRRDEALVLEELPHLSLEELWSLARGNEVPAASHLHDTGCLTCRRTVELLAEDRALLRFSQLDSAACQTILSTGLFGRVTESAALAGETVAQSPRGRLEEAPAAFTYYPPENRNGLPFLVSLAVLSPAGSHWQYAAVAPGEEAVSIAWSAELSQPASVLLHEVPLECLEDTDLAALQSGYQLQAGDPAARQAWRELAEEGAGMFEVGAEVRNLFSSWLAPAEMPMAAAACLSPEAELERHKSGEALQLEQWFDRWLQGDLSARQQLVDDFARRLASLMRKLFGSPAKSGDLNRAQLHALSLFSEKLPDFPSISLADFLNLEVEQFRALLLQPGEKGAPQFRLSSPPLAAWRNFDVRIQRLPPRQRQVMEYIGLLGYSLHDAAQFMKMLPHKAHYFLDSALKSLPAPPAGWLQSK